MKKVILGVCIVLLSSVCWGQNIMPESVQTVTAKGFGAILANDMVKAKDDAVNDALRKAVEQVVGMMVDSKTVTKNFMLLEDKIYTKTSGYVQKYDIISSTKRPDNSLEVTVKALVKKGDLKSDLDGILTTLRREGLPRMMVLIKEQNLGSYTWNLGQGMNTAETALMDKMMGYGFPFVDAATVKSNIRGSAAQAALNGDVQAATAIANQSGADVLLIGNAKTTISQIAVMRSSGMKTASANLQIRAVRADDGVVMATTSARGVQAHIDEMTGSTMALEKAAKSAADDLKDKIIARYQNNQNSMRQIQLQVTGIKNFTQLNSLKNSLPFYIRGLKNVYQRNFASGSAMFDIEITEKAASVAAELEAKEIEGVQLEVTGLTQNKITARIKNASQSGGEK